MIDLSKKKKMIEDFSEFLENLPENSEIEFNSINKVDLLMLYKEQMGLKAEVKQESLYLQSMIENFKEVFIFLEKSQTVLTKELEERRKEQTIVLEEQQKCLLKPLLCNLIEIRDRLEAGIIYNTTHYSHSFILRFFKKIRSFVESMEEGNLITLRHIDNILSSYDVTLIDTLSQMFDPKFMRAVSVESEEDLPNGLVLEEVRKGFLWKNEVLRVADVKVNKIT